MSNPPLPAFKGVVQLFATVEIDAQIDTVWGLLTDLKSYPLWNPYLRSAIVVDELSHKPTNDQTLQGATLELAMLIHPSVDAKAKPTIGYEHISLVDRSTHQIIWGGGRIPSLFRAETAFALSTTSDGQTRYEARITVGGVSASAFKCFMSGSTQHCLQAMGDALKQRAEATSS